MDRVGEAKAASEADRAWFARDRALREILTVRDIGVWSHYVGDGSQPLHTSIHFNGWGKCRRVGRQREPGRGYPRISVKDAEAGIAIPKIGL